MLLSMEQVSISSGNKKIVDSVSLSVQEKEWYALVGQSGSGKTLLAQSIGQMLLPQLQAEGKIFFQGKELLSMPKKQMRMLRGPKIAYIFQDYQGSFTPFQTIGRHFEEYQKAHGVKNAVLRKEQTVEALFSVGLDESVYSRYPFQLSGGQLQRTSIALALLLSPDLVIADEITTALDSVSVHRILELLAQKQKQTGCAILFITHDWRHVRRYADRLAVMKDGQMIESGGKHRILDHPQHEYTKQLIQAAPVLKKGLASGLQEIKTK